MKSYTIQINEMQRQLIIEGLARANADEALLAQLKQRPGDACDTEAEELDYLLSMFAELPTIDDTHNLTHGFCL